MVKEEKKKKHLLEGIMMSIFKGLGSMLHLAVPSTALYHHATRKTVGVLDLGKVKNRFRISD